MTTMRVIPTQAHAVLDYVTGGALVAAPRLLGLGGSAAGRVLRLAGGGATAYSVFTDYELGAVRTIPMPLHLKMDAAGGVLLLLAAATALRREPTGERLAVTALGLFHLFAASATRACGGGSGQRACAAGDHDTRGRA